MSMTSSGRPGAETDRLRIGGVFSRSTGVLSRHLPLFVLVSLAAQLPNVLLTLRGTADARPSSMEEIAKVAAFAVLLIVVLMPITQTVIYHAAFQDMRGRPIRLNESIAIGLRRFLPVFGAIICVGLLVMVGLCFFIVPGIVLLAMCAVAVPTCVVERLGPIASIGRSATLTKGNRWRILGVFLVVFVVGLVAGGINNLIQVTVGDAFAAVTGFVVSSVVGGFTSIVVAVVYHDLRVAREGLDTDRIAAVFD